MAWAVVAYSHHGLGRGHHLLMQLGAHQGGGKQQGFPQGVQPQGQGALQQRLVDGQIVDAERLAVVGVAKVEDQPAAFEGLVAVQQLAILGQGGGQARRGVQLYPKGTQKWLCHDRYLL